MKNKMMSTIMRLVSCAAMFSAVVIANSFCPLVSYQEQEPAAVRNLRKF